jgi:thiol-disulfide isomerase/thioredoxin
LYVCKIEHILDFYSGSSSLIIKRIPMVNGAFSFNLNRDSLRLGIIRFNIQPKNSANGAAIRRGGSGENCCFLILEDTERIRLYANANDFTGTFQVFPGGTNNSIKKLRNILSDRYKLADSISSRMEELTSTDVNMDNLKAIFYNQLLADRPVIQGFVDTVRNIYSKLIGIHQLDIPHALNDSGISRYCMGLLIQLSSRGTDTLLLNSFRQLLKAYDRESYKLSNLFLARYLKRSGDTVKLILRKRLTLIDFWASWCEPCRQANRKELQVINDLSKTQDFEVISISLDKEYRRWLEASAKDKIAWKNYFDPLNFQSGYINDLHINELPSTFLVDINGQIIAKDLVLLELIKVLK